MFLFHELPSVTPTVAIRSKFILYHYCCTQSHDTTPTNTMYTFHVCLYCVQYKYCIVQIFCTHTHTHTHARTQMYGYTMPVSCHVVPCRIVPHRRIASYLIVPYRIACTSYHTQVNIISTVYGIRISKLHCLSLHFSIGFDWILLDSFPFFISTTS
jgi:hypothetical protein